MAPIILIPPKSTLRRTSAVIIVPIAPKSTDDNALQMHSLIFPHSFVNAATKSVTTKKPTAIPNPIQAKRGKTVTVPVILRTRVTTPAIRPVIRPNAVQLILQQQFKEPIISPPVTVYSCYTVW